jgi:tryptophan synthase beta chain
LDYPSVGPEHSYLKDAHRVEYTSATDAEALAAFQTLSRLEGIIPALESAHAIAYLLREGGDAHTFSADDVVVVSLSGRGDKDVYSVADALGVRA